jgi:hypothetical protein
MQLRRVPLRTITVELVAPFHHVAVAPIFLDQLADLIATFSAAPRALDTQHIELTLDVAKYEIAAHFRFYLGDGKRLTIDLTTVSER